MLEHEDEDVARSFGVIISIIEDCFPSVSIGEDFVSRPEMVNQSALDREAFVDRLDAAIPSLLISAEGSFEKLWGVLQTSEPWSEHKVIVEEYLRERGWCV